MIVRFITTVHSWKLWTNTEKLILKMLQSMISTDHGSCWKEISSPNYINTWWHFLHFTALSHSFALFSPDLIPVLPGAPWRVGRPVLLAGAVGIARLPGGEGERQGGVCQVLPTTGGGRRRCRPTTQNLNIRLAATILCFVDVIQLG